MSSDARARSSPFIIPNVWFATAPTPNVVQGASPCSRPSYLMKVPIDDESHLFFTVRTLTTNPSDVPAMFSYERYLHQQRDSPLTDEAVAQIFAGTKSLLVLQYRPMIHAICFR
jgi:hypothetical protein